LHQKLNLGEKVSLKKLKYPHPHSGVPDDLIQGEELKVQNYVGGMD
jgi:hypothetical protein